MTEVQVQEPKATVKKLPLDLIKKRITEFIPKPYKTNLHDELMEATHSLTVHRPYEYEKLFHLIPQLPMPPLECYKGTIETEEITLLSDINVLNPITYNLNRHLISKYKFEYRNHFQLNPILIQKYYTTLKGTTIKSSRQAIHELIKIMKQKNISFNPKELTKELSTILTPWGELFPKQEKIHFVCTNKKEAFYNMSCGIYKEGSSCYHPHGENYHHPILLMTTHGAYLVIYFTDTEIIGRAYGIYNQGHNSITNLYIKTTTLPKSDIIKKTIKQIQPSINAKIKNVSIPKPHRNQTVLYTNGDTYGTLTADYYLTVTGLCEICLKNDLSEGTKRIRHLNICNQCHENQIKSKCDLCSKYISNNDELNVLLQNENQNDIIQLKYCRTSHFTLINKLFPDCPNCNYRRWFEINKCFCEKEICPVCQKKAPTPPPTDSTNKEFYNIHRQCLINPGFDNLFKKYLTKIKPIKEIMNNTTYNTTITKENLLTYNITDWLYRNSNGNPYNERDLHNTLRNEFVNMLKHYEIYESTGTEFQIQKFTWHEIREKINQHVH